VKEFRAAAVETLATFECRYRAVELSAVGFLMLPHAEMRPVIDIEILGPDLVTRTEQIRAISPGEVGTLLAPLLSAHWHRAEALASLEANRSRGWIEQTTQRILDDSGMSVAFAMAELSWTDMLSFSFDGGRRRAWIYWDDGVLKSNFNVPDTNYLVSGDMLSLNPDFPDYAFRELPGARLSQIVQHPLLPSDAMITDIETHAKHKFVELRIPTKPIAPPVTH
jgi:hypothetical protein